MNIGEIARKAGVSRSTVSYVLSGKRQISEATRRRVLDIIEEENFQPSAAARALSHGTTRTLALSVPPLHHHLDTEILRFIGAIVEVAADRDFDTLISSSESDPEGSLRRLVGERRVDGVLLMETRIPDRRAEYLLQQSFPFVSIGRTGFDGRHDWIDTDYVGLVEDAVRRLADEGHSSIALVNRPQELLDAGYGMAVRTRDAFAATCATLGVRGINVSCQEDDSAAHDCLTELWTLAPDATGLVSVNDRSLRGIVADVLARKLSIPQDVSIIAVAADQIAGSISPPITAANVSTIPMSRTAVETLLRRIEDPSGPLVQQQFKSRFADRGSVAAHR